MIGGFQRSVAQSAVPGRFGMCWKAWSCLTGIDANPIARGDQDVQVAQRICRGAPVGF